MTQTPPVPESRKKPSRATKLYWLHVLLGQTVGLVGFTIVAVRFVLHPQGPVALSAAVAGAVLSAVRIGFKIRRFRREK